MSRSNIHRGKAYFNKGKDRKEVEIYLNYCNRRNKEVSFFTEVKNRKINSILCKDMIHQLDEHEYRFS